MKTSNIMLALLGFVINDSYAVTHGKPVICNQEYVLCTSAPCIPDPRHPDYAICSCVVEKGESIGYKSCEERAPKEVKFKVKQLISTFSFEQFKTKKSLTCAKGIPWTNCVDSPCTVNPRDPSQAICSCKILNEQSFLTFGGNCEVKNCENGFWSGATIEADSSLRKPLLKKLNTSADSLANSICPTENK